ncbi:MAG: hypothetical protein JKY65_22290 [Planctomycetes bacterium]|nr:hypothetical protein [Planctomycetota bacterium]
MTRALVLVAALALLAAPVFAEEVPAWDRTSARDEAVRTLKQAQALMKSSERGDARPAAKLLLDSSWILRRMAGVRLGTLGVSAKVRDALVRAAHPTSKPPRADWPPLRAAQALAATREVDLVPAPKLTPLDALKVVLSVVVQESQGGKHSPAVRRDLLFSLMAYRASVSREARVWLATALCRLCPEALLEIGDVKQLAKRGGREGFRWLEENERYLFWQPRAARFWVDKAARKAGQATEAYRRAHPWPKGQGPRPPRSS